MANKTRRERFEEVAANRVQMILDKLDNLSKCANKRNYEFDEKDIKKMFKAIDDAVKAANNKFEAELTQGSKKRETFKF